MHLKINIPNRVRQLQSNNAQFYWYYIIVFYTRNFSTSCFRSNSRVLQKHITSMRTSKYDDNFMYVYCA